jgi:YD repeat-containing protein
MKNILGKTESLELFNKDGILLYNFYKGSDAYSYERTYDSNGNVLTFKDSTGYSSEYTYDSDGRELTYKNSIGYSYEYTYDSDGRELTYKSSTGVSRGFNIPEYTMEELVEKLGNFKIKK